MYICKNCSKEFKEKYSKWSDGNFCCKNCARSYSTKTKRQEINEKLSLKNQGFYYKNGSIINIKEEYYKNPKLCPICGNIIPYEKRNRKTCSIICGRKLTVRNSTYENRGGYRQGSSRGHHGYYKGIYCDSTYELAYLIYCLDHDINIKRCNDVFEYEYEGKTHKYHPDFIVNGELIEIKGYHTELVDIKLESIPDDIQYKILYKEDLKEIFKYVSETYNKRFRDKWNNFYELYDGYGPKYEYICNECGKVFQKDRIIKTETKFCCRSCACKYNQRLLHKNK